MNKKIKYYLILSFAAGLITVLLALFSSPNTNISGFFEKLLIIGIAATGCLTGVSLAARPGWYKKYLQGNYANIKSNPQNKIRKRKGHHPDCNQFKSHTITIKNKTICSGCLGLEIGSIIAVILMVIYLLFHIPKSILIFYLFIIIGLIIISLVYLETIIIKKSTSIHITSNVFLMLSFFLLTIGIFEITGSIMFGFITIILSFLWLDTRIQLSKWRHQIICHNCEELCKMY